MSHNPIFAITALAAKLRAAGRAVTSQALRLRDRCVVVDSISKAHSMTGWRVGCLAGPPEVVDHATRMPSSGYGRDDQRAAAP